MAFEQAPISLIIRVITGESLYRLKPDEQTRREFKLKFIRSSIIAAERLDAKALMSHHKRYRLNVVGNRSWKQNKPRTERSVLEPTF